MSKMRRKRTVAMLTLCATMFSGAVVTYAKTIHAHKEYGLGGTAILYVEVNYQTKLGKDKVWYYSNLRGKSTDLGGIVAENNFYVTYEDEDGNRTYDDLVKCHRMTSVERSHDYSAKVKDASYAAVKTTFDDGSKKYVSADND